MIGRLAAAGLIAAGLWTTVAAAQAAAAPPVWTRMGVQAYEPPKAAPPFALPGLDGRLVRLEDFRGKALLLFFWATW
jgi:cytochrome oxidase Cu insertion factor (SCO1/SenC/PrrC family)